MNILQKATAILLTLALMAGTAGAMGTTEAEAASKYMTRLAFIEEVVKALDLDTEPSEEELTTAGKALTKILTVLGVSDENVSNIISRFGITSSTIKKYAKKYGISNEDAAYVVAAIKAKLITSSQWKSLKSSISYQSAWIILARADEKLNGVTVDTDYAKEWVNKITGLKASSLSAAKKILVAKAYILGYAGNSGDGTLDGKLEAKALKTDLEEAVTKLTFDIDEYMAGIGAKQTTYLSDFYFEGREDMGLSNVLENTFIGYKDYRVTMRASSEFTDIVKASDFSCRAGYSEEKIAAKMDSLGLEDTEGYVWLRTRLDLFTVSYLYDDGIAPWICYNFQVYDAGSQQLIDTDSDDNGTFTVRYNGRIYDGCRWATVSVGGKSFHRFFVFLQVPEGYSDMVIYSGHYDVLDKDPSIGNALIYGKIYFGGKLAYEE